MNALTPGDPGAADLLALSRLDDDGAPPAVPRRPRPAAGRTELMTRTDPAATGITGALDSFYCYNITAALWADAIINRLEGLAIFLLGDELAEIAGRARAAARRLADRIGDLGGAITADPRQLLDRSPGTAEFTLPDCSDVASIGEYGLQRLNIIIAAYEAFLDKVRGTDDVSFHLVLELLAAETHQRADIQAALARRS
jgi:ferritin-like protein